MALMYDMETVNRAMTEAAKLYDPKQKSIRVKRVLDIFAGMKPVEVQPVVHGYWLYGDEYAGHHDVDCSVCGECAREYFDYCPNCGAKMDGRLEA